MKVTATTTTVCVKQNKNPEDLNQPLDKSFDWNCFSSEVITTSEESDEQTTLSECEKAQAEADREQHYDMDGVTLVNGEVITASTPKDCPT